MKKILYIIIISTILKPAFLSSAPNHGPLIKAFYAPYGAGSYNVPYDKTLNGGYDNDLAADSADNKDNQMKTLHGYSVSCGYFHDWIQGDISYSAVRTDNQYIKEISSKGTEYYADASLWNLDARLGYRFNNPGDTSYKWLYLGMRRTNFDIPFNHTEINATGLLAGFYGFSSFGFDWPFELVLTYDINFVFYRSNYNHLKTDIKMDANNKKAVDLGLSAGIGVQYEPWDIAIIFKIYPFISDKYYEEDYPGSNRNTTANMSGTLVGIEIVFTIPEYKNNIVE